MRHIRNTLLAISWLLALAAPALAQSSPGLAYGQIPTAAQWNSFFSAKTDYPGYTPIGPSNVLATAPITATVAGQNVTIACATCLTALTGDVTATGPGSAAATLATSQPGAHTWAASQTMASTVAFSGNVISTIAGDQNNWAPTGTGTYGASTTVYVNGGVADRTITGLTGGAAGRIVTIVNIGTTNNIILANNSGSSSSGNQFLFGQNATLPPGASQALQYDGATSFWRPNGSSSAAVVNAVTPAIGFTANSLIGASGTVVQGIAPANNSLLITNGSGVSAFGTTLANTFTLTPPNNANALAVSGYLDTGAATNSMLNYSGQLNTSGNVNVETMNIVNTACGTCNFVSYQSSGAQVFGVGLNGEVVVNAPSGTTSNLADLQIGGISQFNVSANYGASPPSVAFNVLPSESAATAYVTFALAGTTIWQAYGGASSGAQPLIVTAPGGLEITGSEKWLGFSTDTYLSRLSAASIMAGGLPVSGSNAAATGATFVSNLSTGNATNPDLVFQTGVKTTSGSTQATATTALTLKGETQAADFAFDIVGPNSYYDLTHNGYLTLLVNGTSCNTTAPVSGGNVNCGWLATTTSNFGTFLGTGTPTFSAAEGSFYLENGSGVPYYNTNGSTGWTKVGTGNASFGTASGNTANDIVTMANTTTGVQDSGTLLSSLAPKASPTLTNATVTGSFTATGLVTNADLGSGFGTGVVTALGNTAGGSGGFATEAQLTSLATGSSTGNTVTGPSEIFVCTAACTVTPPVPVAGYQFCVMNDDNVSTVITLGALGSSAYYEKTSRTGYGTAGTGTLSSGGAVGDMICIVGRDSTHYLSPTYVGTWTAS